MPGASLSWGRRLPWLVGVAYVAGVAIRVDAGRTASTWLLGASALVVAFVFARRDVPVVRAAGCGFAIVLASLGARGESPVLDVCRLMGVMACAVAGCLAIARIPGEGGLVRGRAGSPVPGVAAILASSAFAVAARLAPEPAVTGAGAHGAGQPEAWVWLAAAVAGGALLVSTEWTLRTRGLELAVVERAVALRALLGTVIVTGLVLAVLGRARGDGVGCLAVAAAGLLTVLSSLAPDPVRVGRAARRTLVLTIVGGGVALLGATVVEGASAGDAWTATLVTAAVAIAIGTAASALEAPMRPAGGAWLDAFGDACEKATTADPQDAIRETILALRAPAGAGSPSPELWTFSPTNVTTVDAAGYLHERSADLPETLIAVASAETEATLRADVLEALEVRRPEIRPLLKWMTERRALLATVVAWAGETEGVLVMPRVGRTEPATLEEVQALKRVADRLAIACRARGTQARMLDRACAAATRADQADERAERLLRERALDLTRNALASARLARPATVGVYSAASRAALEALEKRTAAGASIALVGPSGSDPVPYLARAHLAGSRSAGPLVLVDATSAREHDVARWNDPAQSPLALSQGGLLVLLDGAALPRDVQQIIARACAE